MNDMQGPNTTVPGGGGRKGSSARSGKQELDEGQELPVDGSGRTVEESGMTESLLPETGDDAKQEHSSR